MAEFGFVGPSYTLSSPFADIQAAINLYCEANEVGLGKGQMHLLPTPGAVRFCAAPSAGLGRGTFSFQGRTFGVAGTNFFEALANGATVNVNPVLNDGNPASFAGNASGQLLIAAGGTVYLFNLNTNTFQTITALAGIDVVQVCYTDAFFLALQDNSNVFYISALEDGTTWDLSNAAALSVFPDNVAAMIADHREVWFLGAKATQVYYDSGAANTPYVPINGAFLEEGCIAPFSVAKLDNSVFWLGGDVDRGQGIVWRANGYTPQRISNFAIEFALQGYSKISDAIAYGYQENGHTFYVLYFPTANVTWVYDCAMQMWHQRSYFSNGVYNAHRSMSHTFNFGMHLVMDPVNGNINQQSTTLQTEADNSLIQRLRRAPHISTEQTFVSHRRLQIDVETGLGTFSGGNTFPGNLVLKDSTGQLWDITMLDNGTPVQTKIQPGPRPQNIYLNDSSGNSWLLGVTTGGMLTATPVTNVATYPNSFLLASVTGLSLWLISVPPSGDLQQTQTPIMRGPQMSLRWSDDGGHTWSNYYTVDCGQLGKYKTRAIWRRLGSSRDRVYEATMSDPIPWRIVNAYLDASPGFPVPQERLPKSIAKIT